MSSDTQWYYGGDRKVVETPTARLVCHGFGSGPPLLLVHGFPMSGFTWRRVLPELARHRTCIVPDLPGLGESEWSAQHDFSFTGQAATLKALADTLQLGAYDVLAQDTGGTFARHLALIDPRVQRLAIVNSEVPGHRPPFIPLYQALMKLPGTKAAFGVLMRSKAFLRSPLGFGGCFCDPALIEGDFHAQVVMPLLQSKARMDGMARYLTGLAWGPVDALATLHGQIRCPVLLVWGTDDPTFPVARAEEMLSQIPDVRMVEVPGARLMAHEEKPAEVASAVVAFLAEPARRATPKGKGAAAATGPRTAAGAAHG